MEFAADIKQRLNISVRRTGKALSGEGVAVVFRNFDLRAIVVNDFFTIELLAKSFFVVFLYYLEFLAPPKEFPFIWAFPDFSFDTHPRINHKCE